MFNREEFENDKVIDIQNAYLDSDLRRKGLDFVIQSDKHKYGYFWTGWDCRLFKCQKI